MLKAVSGFSTLIAVLCLTMIHSAHANTGIQMLPPTPVGSGTTCPSGYQQILTYSGATNASGQSGINCVPISTSAQGDLIASGYVKVGTTNVACDAAHAGAIRWTGTIFQGCNGSQWRSLTPTCHYNYYTLEVRKDTDYWHYYGVSAEVLCINNAPDSTWEIVGYDECYEDAGNCTPDGQLCFYAQQVCE